MNVAQIRQPIAQTEPADGQTETAVVAFQFVFGQIDRRGQNYRTSPARFRETRQKVVSGDHGFAPLHRSQEFLERLGPKRPPMFLLSKHYRVVEIENDSAICTSEKAKLQIVEANRLEQDNHVVPDRFLEYAQTIAETGSSRGNHRDLDPEPLIMLEAIPQTQPCARRVTMFDDAKDLHF
jgi:hypothetical protein